MTRALLALLVGQLIFVAKPVDAQTRKLLWSDEFNGSGTPNPANWTYEEGYIRNREKQFYTRRPENARLENGMLVIEARREPYQGYDYTSASLTTNGKQPMRYGRVEVRAKLPKGVGMWPAIWMLGVNHKQVGWPLCGEIDIMENVGFDPDTIHANVHTKAYNHAIKTNKGAKLFVKAPYDDFHVYAVEWLPDRLEFFVDNQKYFTFTNDGAGKPETWPYDQAHYLILNIAVGGGWGGMRGIDDRIFPQRMLVDYVRVYEPLRP